MNQYGHSLGLQTQNLDAELSRLSASLKQSEQIQAELGRRVFHLKMLYDVSKDLFSSAEPEAILRNGLLMAMGNFGIAEGFVALVDPASGAMHHVVSMGFEEGDAVRFQENLPALRATPGPGGWALAVEAIFRQGGLSPAVELVVPFDVGPTAPGSWLWGKNWSKRITRTTTAS
jgi:hypothetical protein